MVESQERVRLAHGCHCGIVDVLCGLIGFLFGVMGLLIVMLCSSRQGTWRYVVIAAWGAVANAILLAVVYVLFKMDVVS